MQYKLIKDYNSLNRNDVILKIENGITSFVPCNPKNCDYRKYLAWLAQGNTPEEAD